MTEYVIGFSINVNTLRLDLHKYSLKSSYGRREF